MLELKCLQLKRAHSFPVNPQQPEAIPTSYAFLESGPQAVSPAPVRGPPPCSLPSLLALQVSTSSGDSPPAVHTHPLLSWHVYLSHPQQSLQSLHELGAPPGSIAGCRGPGEPPSVMTACHTQRGGTLQTSREPGRRGHRVGVAGTRAPRVGMEGDDRLPCGSVGSRAEGGGLLKDSGSLKPRGHPIPSPLGTSFSV